jgi:hypothetical protein
MVEEKNPEDISHRSQPVSLLEHYKGISDYAKSEILWVRSAYKWAVALAAIVAVVGIYFTYKSSSEFKEEANKEIDRRLSFLELRMKYELDKQVTELGKTVENRVDQEFKTENIKALVESKARTRIDETADPLIKKYMTQSIDPKLKDAEQRLKAVGSELNEAKKMIADLKAISEFTTTVIAAQNDDRRAFDKLKTWANDPSFPRRSEAGQAWVKIMDDHASPFVMGGYSIPWKEGVDPSRLSLSELKTEFLSAPLFIKFGLLEYIWNRKDFPKRERMQFLIDVIKTDQSLKVIENAARFFLSESKQKLKPLAVDQLIEWWDNNKNKIVGN